MEQKETFGDRLKNLRLEKKLTQRQLGLILGITDKSISFYESNTKDPGIEKLKKIADFFGVTIDYLLCRTTEKKVKIISKAQLSKELQELGLDSVAINDLSETELYQELKKLSESADKINKILEMINKLK